MGNGLYRSCLPNKNDEKGSVSLRNSCTPKNRSGKPISKIVNKEIKAIKIQCLYRTLIANKKCKIYKEMKTFDEWFLPVIGKYSDGDYAVKYRGSKLLSIEKEFFQRYGNQFDFTKLYTNNHFNIKRGAITLKHENNDIYEGYWVKNYHNSDNSSDQNNEKIKNYIRNGYGCLYKIDGTKIVGIWNGYNLVGKGLILYNNGKIFEGDISHSNPENYYNGGLTNDNIVNNKSITYYANGNGTMYFPHNSKKIISNEWKKDILHGECIEIHPEKYELKVSYLNGKINHSKGIFTFPNSSVYEGEFDKHYRKNGYGTMFYENGEVYDGYWKKDLYNGAGLLFKPNESLTVQKNRLLHEENSKTNNPFKWGFGKYTKGMWVDGQLHGEGSIATNTHTINCRWRFGKLIQSLAQLNKKIILHDNILEFLTPSEQLALFKIKKNRQIINFFTKNGLTNLVKIRLIQLMTTDIKYYQHNSHSNSLHRNHNNNNFLYVNNFIMNNYQNLENLDEIFLNYQHNFVQFIPIVGYRTNGGIVQKRFHYSNMFNPKKTLAFSSNYLMKKKSDIEISGVFSPEIYNQSFTMNLNKINANLNGSESNSNSLSTQLLKDENRINNRLRQLLWFFDAIKYDHEEINRVRISDLVALANDHIQIFDNFFNQYKIDLYQLKVFDSNVLTASTQEKSFRNSFFTVHHIIIDIPFKLSLYTFLQNPVRILAVYLHDIEVQSEDPINNQFIQDYKLMENIIEEKTLNSNLEILISSLQMEYSIMKVHQCEQNIFIEIDTQEQRGSDKKLLSLIIIKDYKDSHLFSFKKYYHHGRFVTIKLIDQKSLMNAKKTGIDIGSVLFFGQIYKFR